MKLDNSGSINTTCRGLDVGFRAKAFVDPRCGVTSTAVFARAVLSL